MTPVEFRDGDRDVPDHLAILMRGMRTWEMTYEQAVQHANQNLTRQRLETAQRRIIAEHFKKDGTA